MRGVEDFFSEQERLGFKLNMRMLADEFEDYYERVVYYPREDSQCLQSCRFYREKMLPKKKYAHFIWAEQVTEKMREYKGIGFVVVGAVDIGLFSPDSPLIVIEDDIDILDPFDQALRLFSKFMTWDFSLQRAINSENPLNDMLQASVKVFKNPVYVHDRDFFILSCPRRAEGMTVWEMDAKTGRLMVPFSVINDLKIDSEYIHTLQTHEPDMFSANQRGYRILYCNLWNESHYEGRICVNELDARIRPGDYFVLEYLAKVIVLYMAKRNLVWLTLGKNVEEFFCKVLDRKITDGQEVQEFLEMLGWDRGNKYLCIKCKAEQQDFDKLSPVSAFGYIESSVNASYAFLYDQSIVVLVNLTMGENTSSSVTTSLADVRRESLFKMGVSSDLDDFLLMPEAYRQASIALVLGMKSGSTTWCFHYEDYIMDYMFEKICEELPRELLCARPILELMKYDQEHGTSLSETLETYLNLERNVVQTAKALFIHRSTLFYRLERIQKVAEVDLEDPKVRLYLQMSYHLMK